MRKIDGLVTCLFACLIVSLAAVPGEAQNNGESVTGTPTGRSIKAQQVGWTRLWQAGAAPLEIAVGDEPQSVTLQLPPVAHRAGQLVCLRFAVRLHTAQPAGWNHFLKLSVNGALVTPLTSRQLSRVLNHAPAFKSAYSAADPLVPFFADRAGAPALVTFFMPDFSSLDDQVRSERAEGGWYLLDVNDLLHANTPNTLTLTNLAVKRFWNGAPPSDLRMVIDKLELGAVPAADVKRLRNAYLMPRRALSGVSIRDSGTTVTATAGGGVQVQTNGETYFIESIFSHAGAAGTSDNGIGFNEWRCLPKVVGEAAWKPQARRLDARTLQIVAEGKEYRLTRRVVLQGHRIELADTIANKTNEPIGILLRHEVLTPGLPQGHRLSGLQEVALGDRNQPENPTAFVAQDKTALGVLIEDTVLRLQMASEWRDNVSRLSFNHFGLAPRARRTLKWALYPMQRAPGHDVVADHFAFINAVRRDWKVNFTVDGPFDFWDPKYSLAGDDEVAYTRGLAQRKGVKIFALNPWFEYYSNPDMSRAEFKKLMQHRIHLIKSIRPDAKCIACLESDLTRVPISFFGATVPADLPYGRPGSTDPFGKSPGAYGQPATPAMTQLVNQSPWSDSVIRNDKGDVLLDTWYVSFYQGKALNFIVYPTLNNYWQKQMLDKIRFVLDDVGFDGVYFDQFSYAFGDVDHFTYDHWDGYTVDIDPRTGRVTRRYADLGLITAPARTQWIHEVQRRGKIVVANTNPAVTEMQALPVFRFMETGEYAWQGPEPPDRYLLAKGELASPIGLGYPITSDARAKGAPLYNRSVIAHLRYGMLYYNYFLNFPATGGNGGEFGPVKYMFPLTPVELGEGFIIGRERIVSAVSRSFTWPPGRNPGRLRARKPTVRLFDERGRALQPTAGQVVVMPSGANWRVRIKLRNWWQTAVVQ